MAAEVVNLSDFLGKTKHVSAPSDGITMCEKIDQAVALSQVVCAHIGPYLFKLQCLQC